MTLDQLDEPGFYWTRLDHHRPWAIVRVVRRARNPLHPEYNTMVLADSASPPGGWVSDLGEFVGPIPEPTPDSMI